MPVRTRCPYCRTLCEVASQHLGGPVRCGHCDRVFRVEVSAVPQVESETSGAESFRLDIGGATSRGHVRPQNEDSFLVHHLAWSHLDERHEIALLAVLDGVGGHEAGERASGMAIRALGSALLPLLNGALNGQFKDATPQTIAESLDYAIQEANRDVYRKAQSDPALKGMGATAAVVLLWDGQAFVEHVGDCRVYHHRHERLTQVTQDQTLVARMVELGQLSPREAVGHPMRHEVTQAIGKRFEIEPARQELQLASGDWLLVACDGLHTQVSDAVLSQTVPQGGGSAGRLAQQLVELANEAGGHDNCTVVAVRCY